METPGDQYRIESELPSSPKLVLQFLRYTKLAALYTIYTIDFGVPKGGLHNFYCVKANYAH